MTSRSERDLLRDELSLLPGMATLDLRHALALVQKRAGLVITGYPDRHTRRVIRQAAVHARVGRDSPADRCSDGSSTEQIAKLRWQLSELARVVGGGHALPPAPPGADQRRVVSWLAVPTSDGPRPVRLAFDGTTSQYVMSRLAEEGLSEYEPATIATVLAATELADGGFLDVGANIGVFALVVKALLPRTQVTAFEPSTELAAACRSIATLNGLDIAIEELALGERDGEATFYLSPIDTSNSLRAGFRKAVGAVTVEVARLDSWLGAHPDLPSPTVLKVDTESTEPDVLEGAAGLIETNRPWLIVEVLKGRTEDRLETFCDEFGYHRHHIVETGPVARDVVAGDATYTHLNWLLTPTQLPVSFWVAFVRWNDVLAHSVTLELDSWPR